MDITYPNYSVENFNDTRSSRLGKSVLIKNFKKYAEMFPDDQEIQWVASERLSGSTPTYLQKLIRMEGIIFCVINGMTNL